MHTEHCIRKGAYELRGLHTSLQEYDERMEDLQDPNRILAPNDFMDVADSQVQILAQIGT